MPGATIDALTELLPFSKSALTVQPPTVPPEKITIAAEQLWSNPSARPPKRLT